MKKTIKIIKRLNLGYDSDLELIEIDNIKYILKTYKGELAIMKREKELKFHLALKNLNLNCFTFDWLELTQANQLIILWIEDFKTLSETWSHGDLSNLIKVINIIWDTAAQIEENVNLVKSDKDYYSWFFDQINKENRPQVYVKLCGKILEGFKASHENYSLLHGDFHGGNIGVGNNQILLFDSGDCPFLYGHKYHDLSRFIIYFPDGFIYKELPVENKLSHFYEQLKDDFDSSDFLKFCFIQILYTYDNPFVTQVEEIAKYLFDKLKDLEI